MHRKLERRIRWTLEPEAEWWTLVALRSAAAGAAVGLGEFERQLHRSVRHPYAELMGLLTEDPRMELTAALQDRSALRSAYRVLLWAYAAETAVELWAPTYDAEMEAATKVLGTETDFEIETIRRGAWMAREVAGGAALESSRGLAEFRLAALAEIVRAAIGSGPSLQESWIEGVGPEWRESYARGKTAGDSELKHLAPSVLGVQA